MYAGGESKRVCLGMLLAVTLPLTEEQKKKPSARKSTHTDDDDDGK